MASKEEITCPNCRKHCDVAAGFTHDADLNLVCPHCKKVVFATNDDAERGISRPEMASQRKDALAIKQTIGDIPFEHRVKPVSYGRYCI